MRDVKKYRALAAALVALALVAAACGSSKKKTTSAQNTTATTQAVREGGDLVFGAEQEADCLDWIGSCAGAAWGVYTIQGLTMPRTFDFDENSNYKPSVLLTGEPKLEPGPPQKITYSINPKAVWDDGQKITSHDFKYTWDQIVNGADIYDKTGYDQITGVDDSNPAVAVVSYKTAFADWRDLFGGFYGIFPSHLLEGKDRDALMKDGYTFSGGPWKLDHWTKGTETKLVPNPAFWGQKPHLSSITFKLQQDTAAEQAAFKSKQVSMVYPQAQPGQEKLKGLPDTSFDAISGLSYEGLWLNTTKFPLDSLPVRQAVAFATDKDAIVKQLFAPVQPDIKPINSFFTPAFGKAFTDDFKQYTPRSLDKVTELMTSDGWAKGSDGIWAKAGKKAQLEMKSTTGNKRRELTEQILQSQWKEAGFDLTIANEKSSVLFGQDAPKGNYMIALYAQTPASSDPGQCVTWCTKNIPSDANGNSGQNWTRLAAPADIAKRLDDAWGPADTELDVSKRLDLVKQGSKAVADGVPGIPLDPFPDIIAYDSSKIGGPVTHDFSYGPWVNANLWFLK
ncbi:MAG: peptide/nickel transport system substrate-binding protein [Acidimicrobiaceae bacterium]|nr:peptide/nickel transport system substrate-binding protein [Acidimicrobiaceae bacterium]